MVSIREWLEAVTEIRGNPDFPVSSQLDQFRLERGEPVCGRIRHIGMVHRGIRQAFAPDLIIRPGTPITVEFAGTDLSTTEFAPIFTLSPIVMPPRIFAPAPTTT